MKSEEKLQNAIIGVCLNKKACFWSVLIYRLKLEQKDDIPSFATDGTSMFFNNSYVENDVTIPQVETHVAHEADHCARGHFWRCGDRDAEIWNMAGDHVINNDLLDAGFTPTPGWLCDPRFRGMAEEEVYEILLKELGPSPSQQPQAGKGGKKGKGSSSANPGPGKGCGCLVPPSSSEHIPNLKADWEVATIQAAQAAQAVGHLPGFAKRLVDEIRKPKVDWKSVLRRWVQELAKADYTWKRPNSRYLSSGLYLPSLRSETMPPIVIAGDTSGSIGSKILDRFASEMNSILDECKPEKTYVMWWDTQVNHVDEFEASEPLVLNPVGGGGTMVGDVFHYIDREDIEPACVIVLTDMGIGDLNQLPEPGYPVLWASTTEGTREPFGEQLYIGGE
jgi:predicted metal-dependent peptidase